MAYLLNLVLGVYLTSAYVIAKPFDEDAPPELWSFNKSDLDLDKLVRYWNKKHTPDYKDIHFPCLKAHFEIVDKLPEEMYHK